MSDRWRVLLIEDQPPMVLAVRNALRLCDRFEWLGSLSSRADLVELLRAEQPDLVLVDLELPAPASALAQGVDVPTPLEGLRAIQEIFDTCPDSAVVAFSSLVWHDATLARKSLDLGAAVLHKSGEAGMDWDFWLVGALLAIVRGEWRIPPRLLTVLAGLEARQPTASTPSLSPRVAEALAWFQVGATATEIAEEMMIANESTIHRYSSTAQRALGVYSREQAIARAAKLGLMPTLDSERTAKYRGRNVEGT